MAGDPSGWARALADIDSVRSATRSRGAHIVLAVVSEAPLGDVPEDRAQSLIRQAGIERRCATSAHGLRRVTARVNLSRSGSGPRADLRCSGHHLPCMCAQGVRVVVRGASS